MATTESIKDHDNETGDEENPGQSIETPEKQDDEQDVPATKAASVAPKGDNEEDEDLEEGELKDDDEDDDDEEEEDTKRLPGYNNDNNNSPFTKESSSTENRYDPHQQPHHHHHPQHQHHQNYPPHHSASGQPPPHLYPHSSHHQNRRQSPNNQHHAEMHSQYPSNHLHFGNNSNNNHYRYPPNDGPPPPMNHHPQAGAPANMYPRGGPGSVGPMQKVNIRCRFYSKTSNKCTWGDHCRFEHRDDSPGPEFDNRPPPNLGPGSSRGPPPPMSAAERGPYPPYSGRHQPYPPPPPPHGYPYDAYAHQHSTPPPLPPHSMSRWRQQHSPYPSPSSAHPPESVSPALLPTPAGSGSGPGSSSGSRGGHPSQQQPPPPGSSGGSGSSGGGGGGGSGGGPGAGPLPVGGALSPGYPSPSSSAAIYENRKQRLAYELAPYEVRGYPPPSKYDRGDPAGYPGSRGFYRNHYTREPPYGREPPPHMGGPYPGYSTYPSAYRGGSMGPHASHYKFMSSSQRTVPPDTRRSRSNKRGHDEDESSWSDSGSEDSILGQATYNNKNHATKASKQQAPENLASDDPIEEQGSGTPPGEPLPEDRERQEMLLNKLKEIEDLMAKKKGEQEDPM